MVDNSFLRPIPKPSDRDPTTFRPRLRRGYLGFAASPNEVQIQTGALMGPVYTVRDEEGSGDVARFFDLLDGSRTEAEILASLPEEKRDSFRAFVEHFLDQQYLEPAGPWSGDSTAADLEEWPELVTSLSLTTRDYLGAFNRMRKASIVVLGAGRLGRLVAEGLGRLGIGTVKVWDSPGPASKAASCVAELAASFPRSRFETLPNDLEDLGSALAGHDLVVVAQDALAPTLFEAVNEASLKDRFRWVMAYTDGYDAHIGPMFIPYETACYTCMTLRLRGNVKDWARHQRYVDLWRRAGRGSAPLVIGSSEIVAGTLLLEIPLFVEFGYGSLSGVAVLHDLQTLTMEVENVFRLPRCPSCGKLARSEPMRQTHATLSNVIQLRPERRPQANLPPPSPRRD